MTRNLTLSDDGRFLATSLGGGPVIVIDTANGSEQNRYHVGTKVSSLVLSPDGDSLAAVDERGLVHLWHRPSGRSHLLKPDDLDGARETHCPVFSPDGRRLATTSWGRPGGAQPLAVWDVATGRRLGTLPSPDRGGLTLIFTADNHSLIDNGGRSPRTWHFEPPAEPPSPAGHTDEAWAASYSPDGKILATGSDDTKEPRTINLWDPATGRLIRGWNAGVGTVAALAFSPDGRMIALGHLTESDNVRLWETATGKLLGTLSGHTSKVRSVAFSPDGRTLATASDDQSIGLWDPARQTPIHRLVGHEGKVRQLAFSPDGRTLASCSNDHSVRLWDVATGRALGRQAGSTHLAAVAFAQGGSTLATADEAGVVRIRDATSLDVLKTMQAEPDQLLALAFAPDGRSLATSGRSGVVHLWDTLTGQLLLTLPSRKAQVNAIAFAPDGSSLAACAHDGSVTLWRGGPG
jgi:WD40 repeat protein